MIHIMVDLETLSTAYNARILAIGAVKFDHEQGVYGKFYQAVTVPTLGTLLAEGMDEDGFHISSDTLNWWAEQNEEARKVFTDPNSVSTYNALKAFTDWATWNTEPKHICMWGNGASFDNVILSTAYNICNLPLPWKFYNDRCYRTVKNMYKHVEFVRTGTYHNALDDAESQAIHLLAMKTELA